MMESLLILESIIQKLKVSLTNYSTGAGAKQSYIKHQNDMIESLVKVYNLVETSAMDPITEDLNKIILSIKKSKNRVDGIYIHIIANPNGRNIHFFQLNQPI
jgi:hypothetical protein